LSGVLKDAEHIYNNSIDVSIDMHGTKGGAASIYKMMQERSYSTESWSQHELHPKPSEGFSKVDIVNFVFTIDLLNFSYSVTIIPLLVLALTCDRFWSDLPEDRRFQVEYRGRRWTGYNSLVACLRRAVDEGVPITTPRFWNDPVCSDQTFEQVFRSATNEPIPLLAERIANLREAAGVLDEVGPPRRWSDKTR
jgi:hypothetical protein